MTIPASSDASSTPQSSVPPRAVSTHAHPPSPGSDIALPEVRMHNYRPNEPVNGRIARNDLCTARKAAGFVRHVEIDVSGTNLVGQVRPGQAFGIIPPGVDDKGRPHKVRLYSVSSPTRGEDSGPPGSVIATTVKRTIDEDWETHKLFLGVASNFLCDAQPGDPVLLSGPNGKRFILPASPDQHDYFFFATGTGIAPFRGMVMDLLESGCPSKIVLIMGSPYATDLLYHDYFLRAASEHPNFQYATAISRERQSDGHDPMYVQDRLRTDRDRLVPLLDSDRTLIYICGLAGMELGIFQQLALVLRQSAMENYLQVDPETLGDVKSWSRSMLHKEVRPTRKVFMEVYA